nr:40s ribosomal protein s25-4 [Quercus suber]
MKASVNVKELFDISELKLKSKVYALFSFCTFSQEPNTDLSNVAPKKEKAPPPSSKPTKSSRGKQKKKKWSKGKQKEKVNNMVLFD